MAAVFLRSQDAREREKEKILRLYAEREIRKVDKSKKKPHYPDGCAKNAPQLRAKAARRGNEAALALVAELAAVDEPIGVKTCTVSTTAGRKKLSVSLDELIMDRADMERDNLESRDLGGYLPLDNPMIVHVRNKNRNTSLGILAPLPNEIVDNILLVADIQTLTTLRGVNTYVRNLISDMPQYKEVYEHGVSALRAMLASGSARYHSIRKLHTTLRSFNCSHCMEYRDEDDKHIEYGNQLYLPTCERYCFDCSGWMFKNQESIITEEKAVEFLGAIDETIFENLPYIVYRQSMYPRDKTLEFDIDPFKEKRVYMQKEVSEAVARQFGPAYLDNTLFNVYRREVSRPLAQRRKDHAFRQQLQKTGGHLRWFDRVSQYFFVGLPALENPRLGLSDWGSVCKGCYATRFERDIWHPYSDDPEPAPLLSSSQMLEHLNSCMYAEELQKATLNPTHKKHEFYTLIVRERYPSESWREGLYNRYIPPFHHEWDDDVDDPEDESDMEGVPNNAGQANNLPEFPQAVLDDLSVFDLNDPQAALPNGLPPQVNPAEFDLIGTLVGQWLDPNNII